MKFITFSRQGRTSAGLWLEDDRVLDLEFARELSGQAGDLSSVLAIIAGGEAALAVVQALSRDPPCDAICPADQVRLEAPIPRPARNIFAVGKNYLDHVAEVAQARGEAPDQVKAPQFFSKATNTVLRPDGDIRLDPSVTRFLDYEVELAVVIGKTGRDIPAAAAFDHVFGYTICNDVTARDLQKLHVQFFKGKSLDTTLPLGPWIIDKDALDAPETLELTLTVNGQERQRGKVSSMIFDVPSIIEWLSKGMTLEPGDIIATGTPAGVGFAMDPPQALKGGDVVTCAIDRIGALTNRVVEV